MWVSQLTKNIKKVRSLVRQPKVSQPAAGRSKAMEKKKIVMS